ncbi:programmed cell death protein 6-interacting protein, partial [Reticulomyxa filosa]
LHLFRTSQVVVSVYGKAKIEELGTKLKEINQLRKDCMVEEKTANPTVDIPKLLQYYNVMCVLEKRFPFGKTSTGWFSKVQSVMIEFRWCDAFNSKKISTNYSIKLDKVSILYNLGALMRLFLCFVFFGCLHI